MPLTGESPTDAELIARVRAGEPAALGPLFDRYEGPLFRYLFGILKDAAAAEDALQETFVTALRKADGADGDTLRGWLFTVAHRLALVELRRRRGQAVASDDAAVALLEGAGGNPAARAEARDTAAAVRRILDELPAPQQAVLRLRLFDGLRFREVAERLGCPLNTALARMHDGLRNFRARWEALHA